MGKTALFSRKIPGGVFVITDESHTTGNRWFVDSGSATGADSVGAGTNPDTPFLTLDYAIGQATASNGDVIYLMPGHAETLTTAGAVTIDQAGLTIIGLGEGAARPTFTFSSTDNSASVLITSASTKIKNIIGVGNDDGMTNPFHVQAADTELDIEWHDTSASVEAATVILTTAAADRLKVNLKYLGFVTGNAVVSPIQLVGVNDADIYVDFYGIASTSVVDMLTTACTDIKVKGIFYVSGTTDLSKNVTANIGGCTWSVSGFDAAAGCSFSGGSGAAVGKDDVSVVNSTLGASTDTAYTTATANTTASAMKYVKSHQNVLGLRNQSAFTTATANTTASVSQYVKSVQNVLGVRSQAAYTTATANTTASVSQYVKSVQNVIGIQGSSKNTAGVSSTVSVVSYVKELVDNTMGDINSARDKKLTVTADLTSATWATKTAHEIGVVSGQVRVRVLPIVTATAASNAAACLIKLGTSGQTTAMLANTTAQFLTTGRIWNVTTAFQKTINYSGIFDKVVSGDDIGYSISGKTASAGTIVFHIWWEPLVTGSTVTAGTGGAF